MTRLSVNVNKLATLRNSRGKNLPDVTAGARKILSFGAHGITVHPRPDGRHIRPPDVTAIRDLVLGWPVPVEFNVEGYPSADFMEMIRQSRPHQVTLVPDPPEALTSNAGWDLVANEEAIKEVVLRLRQFKARVSIFVDPARMDEAQSKALSRIQPDRIELYTEAYADAFDTDEREAVTAIYAKAALRAYRLEIGVNAGHDLNQNNLGFLLERVPQIEEVSIGHAIFCEAIEDGLETTIKRYVDIVNRS